MIQQDISPYVTVVTATYRKFDKLEDTIKSVLEQSYLNLEYIIVDDGSENFDKKYIDTLVKNNNKNNLNVSVIHHNQNLGTVKSINVAWKKAKGEYVIGLSTEDLFANKDVIKNVVNRMIATKSMITALRRVQFTENNEMLRKMPADDYLEKIKKMDSPYKQYVGLVTGNFHEMASGSAICISKELLNKIGYFNEEYTYWEDGPFFAKCNENGIKIYTAYDFDSVLYRTGGMSSINSKSKVSQALRKEAQSFYKKALKEDCFKLPIWTKRVLRYASQLDLNGSKTEMFALRIRYLDVAMWRMFSGFIKKCKHRNH